MEGWMPMWLAQGDYISILDGLCFTLLHRMRPNLLHTPSGSDGQSMGRE